MAGVADHLVARMREAGVRALFGLPGGGGNLDAIDAARRAGLPFVLTATETGSALAALAQAEILGSPGACLTTLGPGVSSVANGVACAQLDRAPLLVLTDSAASDAASFTHQRIDHHRVLAPLTKWSGSLKPPGAFQAIDDAFVQLGDRPPGPVHLDCPGDFERAVPPAPASRAAAAIRTPADPQPPDQRASLDRLLEGSRKPLLIVGLGARRPDDADAIRALCEVRGLPALVTYKAKGVVPDEHPWFAGLFTNGAIESAIVEECDLLIGVGFDPVEILPRPWPWSAPVVSLASWRMAGDHVPFQAQRVGVVAELVREAGDKLRHSAWDANRAQHALETTRRAIDPPAAGMTAQDVVKIAARQCGSRCRVTVDAGAHMFPATMLWPVAEPGGLLISNGLSTMGFAVPAAVGAALVDRDRPVVALTGDGGLLICLGELATASRERLRIVTIVFSDSSLSLIEIKQQQRGLAPAGVALGDIQWPRVAEGFGLAAWTVTTGLELEAAIDAALQVDGPSLIEARIDRSTYGAILKAIRG